MSIDFESKDGRHDYLVDKLDNLLSGINDTYGQVLLEELVTRLERTLADFNEEFQHIIGDLKSSSERRHQILHDLMEGKDAIVQTSTSSDADTPSGSTGPDTSEMSEWEKRLEGK